jgi:hypothetical protein
MMAVPENRMGGCVPSLSAARGLRRRSLSREVGRLGALDAGRLGDYPGERTTRR